MRGTLAERFDAQHLPEPTSGCYLWAGAVTLDPAGQPKYGKLRGADGRTLLAHRVSYELHVGPIGDGLTIDHLCRVRLCVNPDHLEPCTIAVNVSRAVDAKYPGRNRPAAVPASFKATHCRHGHEFTAENSLWHSRPGRGGHGVERVCRTCWVERSRANRARRAARRAETSREVATMGTRIGA